MRSGLRIPLTCEALGPIASVNTGSGITHLCTHTHYIHITQNHTRIINAWFEAFRLVASNLNGNALRINHQAGYTVAWLPRKLWL